MKLAKNYFDELSKTLDKIDSDELQRACDIFYNAYKNGRQIFVMGNGGSAATASHFVCDMNKGTVQNHNGKENRFRIVCLNDNIPTMTAYGNDISYDKIFSEHLKNLMNPSDVLLVITGSGNSKNLLESVKVASETGVITVGFLGFDGGKLKSMLDHHVHVPSSHYGRIEDIHLMFCHLITDYFKEQKKNEIKSVLVTGNLGYIGSVLTQELKDKNYEVIGLDCDFYDCLEEPPKVNQITKDIRKVNEDDLKNIDAVVHLAALSNDPLGEFNPNLTREINYDTTVNLAKLAKKCKVKRFIYASSQSMYGISKSNEELDEEDSEKNPVTEYAKTKWQAELEIKKLATNDFIVACFRPSTVFGVSPRLRCDVVYNNLIACAYTTGKIEIYTDGSPWRPVVHVKDVCSAFIAGLKAPKALVNKESFNVGIKDGNYTVKDLALTAGKIVGNAKVEFTGKHTDPRTYIVSFKKILSVLKDYYQPERDLEKGGMELIEYFDRIGFNEEMFRGRKCNRLAQLKHLIDCKKIDVNFYKNHKLNISQAVILAGGLGTRLLPITEKIPKPMVEINGKPFLHHLIDLLKENNLSEVILLLGYKSDKIKEYFGNGAKFGIKIKYSVAPVSFSKGERLLEAKDLLKENFLLMYCDNHHPLNLKELEKHHLKHDSVITKTVYSNKDNFTKSNLIIKDGLVTKYDKSREDKNLNGVNLGFMIVNKNALSFIEKNQGSLDKALSELASMNKIAGFVSDHKYYSISNIERLPTTTKYLNGSKTIFLDRDGVINKRPKKADYVKKWNEFEFLPGSIEAIKLLNQHKYNIFVLTNQPGIARKMMTAQDLEDIHLKLNDELKKNNAKIHGIYHCPHGWDDGCECRKPSPGMLFSAAKDHHINLKKSILIGDDERDIEAGQKAGCETYLVGGENSLLDTVKHIIKNGKN